LERHRNPTGPIIRHNADGIVRLISETKLPDGSTIITQNDITEVVEAEKEVKRQKVLFEAAINNAPYAMLMTNMEREVVLCNPEFARIFGYNEDEIIGQSTEIFYKNREDFETRGHIRALLNESGDQHTDQITYKRKNGDTFPAETAVAAIGDTQEKIFGYIVIIQDISERLKREEETQQYQQIISDSRRLSLLGEMAAGLAHEINQPLSAITNYTEGCIQRLENKTAEPEAIRDALKIVTEQADRAGQIISRIRGFVKKEAVEKQKLGTADIIEEAVRLVKPDLERRGIDLSTDLEMSECPVSVDKIQIQQVILNLIRNASDAMEEHGTKSQKITVSTKVTDDNTVEISVTDTGPGIPKAKLNQIFDPFYTTKSSGLGLGLNICQSIIESHGGRMWATSSKKGAAIHLTLPLAIKGFNNKEKQRAA
jgi:PAS domain S-box-containing protein